MKNIRCLGKFHNLAVWSWPHCALLTAFLLGCIIHVDILIRSDSDVSKNRSGAGRETSSLLSVCWRAAQDGALHGEVAGTCCGYLRRSTLIRAPCVSQAHRTPAHTYGKICQRKHTQEFSPAKMLIFSTNKPSLKSCRNTNNLYASRCKDKFFCRATQRSKARNKQRVTRRISCGDDDSTN